MSNARSCDKAATCGTEEGIDILRRFYKQDIVDSPRTQRLQQQVDEEVDRSLTVLRDSGDLRHAQGGSITFALFSSLSRHHKSAEVQEYCTRAYEEWADNRLADTSPAEGLSHERAWNICTIVPGFIWLEDYMKPELRAKMMQAFAYDDARFRKRKSSGQIGNQEMANCMADLLYASAISNPELIALAREEGDAALCRALNEDGQVVEQYGPCPHYSYLAYLFAFEYVMITGSREFDDRLKASLDWYRKYHTNSLYLIAGPSTRKYHLREMTRPSDIYGGLAYFAPSQPMYQKLLDRMTKTHSGAQSTQILLDKGGDLEPTEEQVKEWNKPFGMFYERIYYGRGPIKYALVSRQYQTGITFTGWLPLMGLQTWAWGDEPPIIHPVHDIPSGTEAWGIDTARFPCNHLYYKSGPGCMAAEVAWRGDGSSRENLPDEPAFVVWRNGKLRTVAIFTDVSTVVILTGPTGKRTTQWTLNAVEPAAPIFGEDGLVSFEGRTGCIHALQAGEPRLLEGQAVERMQGAREATEMPVQSLLYESDGETATIFALSNGSFSAIKNDLDTNSVFEFKDDGGTYRADISTIVDERGDLTYGLDTAKIKQIG